MNRIVWLSMALLLASCRGEPQSPLAKAAAANDVTSLRALMISGADPDSLDDGGWPPIMWAVRNGHPEAVTALLDGGADINLTDRNNGWTPLMHAIHKDQRRMVDLLLDCGADPNALSRGKKMSPLVMAAGYGQTEIVGSLIRAGADPTLSVADGWTPLDAAVAGVGDIDRFTIGQCQTATVRAILDAAPEARVTGRLTTLPARLGGCGDVVELVNR